jgi:hypothetical protein
MNPLTAKVGEIVLTGAAQKALDLGFDKLKSVLTRVRTELNTPQYDIDRDRAFYGVSVGFDCCSDQFFRAESDSFYLPKVRRVVENGFSFWIDPEDGLFASRGTSSRVLGDMSRLTVDSLKRISIVCRGALAHLPRSRLP